MIQHAELRSGPQCLTLSLFEADMIQGSSCCWFASLVIKIGTGCPCSASCLNPAVFLVWIWIYTRTSHLWLSRCGISCALESLGFTLFCKSPLAPAGIIPTPGLYPPCLLATLSSFSNVQCPRSRSSCPRFRWILW